MNAVRGRLFVAVLVAAMAFVAIWLGVSNAPDTNAGLVRISTPDGDAAAELVPDSDPVIMPSGRFAFRLVNRGQVTLMTGREFSVEYLQGDRWVPVPVSDEPIVWPAIGIVLKAGERTDTQKWPIGAERVRTSGRYRIVKVAVYEDSRDGLLHQLPRLELEFEVVEPGS